MSTEKRYYWFYLFKAIYGVASRISYLACLITIILCATFVSLFYLLGLLVLCLYILLNECFLNVLEMIDITYKKSTEIDESLCRYIEHWTHQKVETQKPKSIKESPIEDTSSSNKKIKVDNSKITGNIYCKECWEQVSNKDKVCPKCNTILSKNNIIITKKED